MGNIMVDAILSQFNVQLVIVKGVRCAYCYKHDPEINCHLAVVQHLSCSTKIQSNRLLPKIDRKKPGWRSQQTDQVHESAVP